MSSKAKKAVLPLVVVAAVGAGMLLAWQGNTTETYSVPGARGRQNIPSRVGDLKLTTWTAGQAAVAQMNRLHGKDLYLEDGYIAEYQGAQQRMTAWVARAASVRDADDLLTRMTQRIETGNQVFTNLREIEVEGYPVFSVDGAEGQNFYFKKGAWVIWLAIRGEEPLSLVADSILAFPAGEALRGPGEPAKAGVMAA